MKQTNNLSITAIASILFLTAHLHGSTVTADISYGELVDKITILTIKSERISNPEKLKNIYTELQALQKRYADYVGNRIDIPQLQELLKKINEELWDIEDAIRIKERNQEFDDEFIKIARSVYITNDKRCAVKKEIDMLLGSHITEEKSYEEFV